MAVKNKKIMNKKYCNLLLLSVSAFLPLTISACKQNTNKDFSEKEIKKTDQEINEIELFKLEYKKEKDFVFEPINKLIDLNSQFNATLKEDDIFISKIKDNLELFKNIYFSLIWFINFNSHIIKNSKALKKSFQNIIDYVHKISNSSIDKWNTQIKILTLLYNQMPSPYVDDKTS